MNRVCGHSSVNDDNVPARTQLAIELKPLDIVLQPWEIRFSLERNLGVNVHEEGKIRPREETQELETQSHVTCRVVQSCDSIHNHVQRIPLANHRAAEQQGQYNQYAG